MYPGTIRIDWQGYEIETSLTIFALLLFVTLFLLSLIGKIWRAIARLPMRLGRRAQKRHREKGLISLVEAITANALEQISLTKEKAYKVQRFLNTPLQHHLLFEAALHEANMQRAEQQIIEMNNYPEMRELALYEQIRLCYAQNENAQAHTHLLELERIEPQSPYVLKNLLGTSVFLSLFDKALEIVQKMYKNNLLTKEKWERYQAQLLYAQSQQHSQDMQERLGALKKVHQLDPGFFPAAIEMAKILKVQSKERQARKVLETTWETDPNPNLVPLYLSITAEEKNIAIQRLAHLSPKHPESLLLLAQNAIEHQEWRKARTSLKALEETYGMTLQACHLMAQIELKEKSNLDQYQYWMDQALKTQDTSAWICNNCCATSKTWKIFCQKCHNIGCFEQCKQGFKQK
ncbi:MAG: heme biosynthesis HemY N-terminal domain-containing protein [Pseudomonadota bacterium]